MDKNTLYEIIGWYGFIGLLVAYALISLEFVSANDLWYQILNLTGALGIASACFYKKTYQPAVLNLIWAIIAGITLAKSLL
jgi:hypothetical protein